MRYLIIGICSLVVTVCIHQSCNQYKNTSWAYTITYVYTNLSGVNVIIEAYQKEAGRQFILGQKWDVPNEKSIEFEPRTNDGGGPEPFNFRSNFGPTYDSVVIRFDNEKCLHYGRKYIPKTRDIFLREHYLEYEMRLNKSKKHDAPYYNSHDFTLTWIFTPEDVAQAVNCDMF